MVTTKLNWSATSPFCIHKQIKGLTGKFFYIKFRALEASVLITYEMKHMRLHHLS